MFIGTEKPIANLVKYKFYDTLISEDFITLTTSAVLKNFPFLPNPVIFKSNWRKQDIRLFHLHLLISNYLSNNNRGLYYDLRSFLIGPYKIKSFNLLFQSLKYIRKSISEIKFFYIFKKYRSTPTEILMGLRERGHISNGDVINFKNILRQHNISRVITISSLRDPKLFDLSIACKELNLECHLFVECWDNISTGLGVPTGISKIYLWSEQQRLDFYKFNPVSSVGAEIFGSYRISHAQNSRADNSVKNNKNFSNVFRILYLEGYFYENLNFSITQIIRVIKAIQATNNLFLKVEIVVRKYPLKRQSIQKELERNYHNFNLHSEPETVRVTTSDNNSLDFDLNEADLVISELTTAGLEAAFRKIPVIFIGSNASIRFLDSMAGYNYSFAESIPIAFNLINLSKKTDLDLLEKLIYSLIYLNDETHNFESKLLLNESNLELFGKPFDLNIWYKLID